MIQSLKIKNYALIDNIDIDFNPGFLTITGETGAGKSILIGALSLVLGNRADTNVLRDENNKCVIEASFRIDQYNLKWLFERYDLDFEPETILRREIRDNGKSRAFINDTPVNIKVLKELGDQLVDVHSQHQNLILKDNSFHLDVVDSFAAHYELLHEYKEHYKDYRKLENQYKKLKHEAEQSKADLDYYQFQYDQLEKAKLQEDEQQELESELETLNHAEEIKHSLSGAYHLLTNEEYSILNQLKEAGDYLKKIIEYFPKVKEISERTDSAYIELQDISGELDILNSDIEYDPERIEYIRERLDEIYSLQHKHNVDTVQDLISIKNELEQKIEQIDSADYRLEEMEKSLTQKRNHLEKLASQLSESRGKAIAPIERKITGMLVELGIPNAKFKIEKNTLEDFTDSGKDGIRFLFSANKNISPEEISKVASGGELSRLMLSLKSLIAETKALPTIIFDEIDSGTSGDIADKMGSIMKMMSENMQVINITHLPQIASKGDYQFLVYKEDDPKHTYTNIRKLNKEERIQEIAKMLSGEQLTETAIQNAREFLSTSVKKSS